MKVINVGSLNLDHVYRVDRFLLPGETKPSQSYKITAGGKGLNQSIALAKAGATVYHGGAVGENCELLLQALRNAGVHLEYLMHLREPCGHAVIQVDDQGQNCILIHGGTNRMLNRQYIDDLLGHSCSDDIVLVQNETNLVDYVIEQAARRGVRVAMNAAPISEEVKRYPLEKLHWLIVNEIEGAQLTGQKSYEEIMNHLQKSYPQTAIVMTLGSEGVWYRDGHQDIRLSACQVSNLVDTTAAGDTFVGYFLESILSGARERDALVRASVASALAIERLGAAESIPLASEVEKALASGRYTVETLG
ncbi:MAG TPA: ribokinase [Clostridiales bacterium]|nr:ribokinase [Clostridiales bacterium]